VKFSQRWYLRHQLFNQYLEPDIQPWLFDASSLTARLIALCDENFSVRVLSQRWEKISPEEAAALSSKNTRSALVRQVLLCCGDVPLVYARTIIPAATMQGAQRRYANMGNRPLGAMLFADRTMRREAVEVGVLPAGHRAYEYTESKEPVWGRRSVFRVGGRPLLVSEYFYSELLDRAS
jgi:chorismate--pyruvate lyase